MDIVTPIDGSVVGSIPAATKTDVEKAIAAANTAHKSGVWGKLPGGNRGSIMRSIAGEVGGGGKQGTLVCSILQKKIIISHSTPPPEDTAWLNQVYFKLDGVQAKGTRSLICLLSC
jgi:hypothetical protein